MIGHNYELSVMRPLEKTPVDYPSSIHLKNILWTFFFIHTTLHGYLRILQFKKKYFKKSDLQHQIKLMN